MKNSVSTKNQLKNRLRFVKIKDVLSIFPMILGLMFSIFHRLRHRNIWLVCERRNEARDNGYWFYKYLCESHPEIEAVYAIDLSSVDYLKIKNLGKVIQFGSINHWKHYFSAKRNISSQKEGKPNTALCFFLEVVLGVQSNRVYLKHGIVKDDQRWIYYDVSKMNLICCASDREYEFIKMKFGYPESSIQLTGLCRYDNLWNKNTESNQILIMPTMREWLRVKSTDTIKYEKSESFIESDFYTFWNSLINSAELCQLLTDFKMKLVFFLHSSMQQYRNQFSANSNVTIADSSEYDVQNLLLQSKVLITDYSSIFFDFAYMMKPLVYYQFDYEKYRLGQYQEGYFSYELDGFGPVAYSESELLIQIRYILLNQSTMNDRYKKRVREFFAFWDSKNCERTFQVVSEMK